jgi:hypothetical protein
MYTPVEYGTHSRIRTPVFKNKHPWTNEGPNRAGHWGPYARPVP